MTFILSIYNTQWIIYNTYYSYGHICDSRVRSGVVKDGVSSLPRHTLQHLSLKAICSDSAQLSSGQGSLGTTRCIVLSCDGQRHNPRELLLRSTLPLSFAKGLDVIMKVITHLLCFLSHSPSSLCVHYKPRKKIKRLSSSLLLSVIYIVIHDASLLYKQWINLLDYPCMCV